MKYELSVDINESELRIWLESKGYTFVKTEVKTLNVEDRYYDQISHTISVFFWMPIKDGKPIYGEPKENISYHFYQESRLGGAIENHFIRLLGKRELESSLRNLLGFNF